MTKNQKMLLGVGAVAAVGYLVYKNMNKSKGFAAMGPQPVFANASGLSTLLAGKRPKPIGGTCSAATDGGGKDQCCYAGGFDAASQMYKCCKGGKAENTRYFGCANAMSDRMSAY